MTLTARLMKRAITPAQVFGAGLDDWQNGDTAAGVRITAEEVMRAAAGACIRLLADDISSLPIDVYRKSGDDNIPITAPDWYLYPTTRRWDTWPHHVSQVVVSLLTDGNAFIEGVPDAMNPEHLNVLDPRAVDIRDANGQTTFVYRGSSPYGNAGRTYSDAEMMHIPWISMPGKGRGLSVIEATKESSGLELAAREWAARFFSNGATLGGIIEIPREAGSISKEAAETLRDQFTNRHQGKRKAFALGVLSGGARWVQNTVSPEDAALSPLWRHVLEEAARLFHVPPHLLASQESGGQAYASVEHRSIEYVQHAIVPIIRRLEEAYSRLIPGNDTYIRWNVSALLRGDIKTRAEAYSILLQNRIMRLEEARSDEGFRPDPNVKGYLSTPNNTMPDSRLVDLQRLIDAGFDAEASLAYLGLPSIAHSGALAGTPEQQPIGQMTGRSLGDHREDRMPDLHVHLPSIQVDGPQVDIQSPDIRIEPQTINVQLPEQVVNVAAPEVRIEPPVVNVAAPEIRVEPSPLIPNIMVQAPDTQNVRIVSLPPMNAKIKRDQQGRISEVNDNG